MPTPFETKALQRPIGYWIRSADRCLTEAIEAIQSDLGLGRREWQVVNTLAETGTGKPFGQLLESLSPIIGDGELRLVLTDLENQNHLRSEGDVWRLTSTGREAHKCAMERQTAFRERAMQGISEADYLVAVTVLARLVSNCSTSEDA
ncbi:hypothetical protein [Roseibium sp. LAB1]